MVELTGVLGVVVGSLAAVISALLGLSRPARLRRDERTFREAMQATENEDQRHILESLHQQAVGHLVSRTLVPPRAYVWPILALAGSAAGYGYVGFVVASHVEAGQPLSAGLEQVWFDGSAGAGVALVVLLLLSFSTVSHLGQLSEHRRVHRQRYLSGESEVHVAGRGSPFRPKLGLATVTFVVSLLPASLFVGFMVGLVGAGSRFGDMAGSGLILVVGPWALLLVGLSGHSIAETSSSDPRTHPALPDPPLPDPNQIASRTESVPGRLRRLRSAWRRPEAGLQGDSPE